MSEHPVHVGVGCMKYLSLLWHDTKHGSFSRARCSLCLKLYQKGVSMRCCE